MTKAIYFDMDGTIADLYNYPNWLECLNNCDVAPYENAQPLANMDELNNILDRLAAIGYIIGVITWTAMNGTKEYNKATRNAKKAWIKKYLPCVTEFHAVKYGTPKHVTANVKGGILVDDNADVRTAWENYTEENFTIDATDTQKMMINLKDLLAIAA